MSQQLADYLHEQSVPATARAPAQPRNRDMHTIATYCTTRRRRLFRWWAGCAQSAVERPVRACVELSSLCRECLGAWQPEYIRQQLCVIPRCRNALCNGRVMLYRLTAPTMAHAGRAMQTAARSPACQRHSTNSDAKSLGCGGVCASRQTHSLADEPAHAVATSQAHSSASAETAATWAKHQPYQCVGRHRVRRRVVSG